MLTMINESIIVVNDACRELSRLPLDKIVFENEYQDIDPASLKDYDQIVNTYYDLRDANRRIDTFTDQVNGPKLNGTPQVRDQIAQVLHDQKLCLDL